MAYKTTEAIEMAMYEAVEEFVTENIGGGFYPSDCRPADSQAEDAVLTVSYVNAEQVQEGRAKLNIYVADIDNGSGRPVPNKARLEELAELGDELIERWNAADTNYDYYLSAGTTTLADPEIKQHFVNINIGFRLITF
jgi:hypothetical protein